MSQSSVELTTLPSSQQTGTAKSSAFELPLGTAPEYAEREELPVLPSEDPDEMSTGISRAKGSVIIATASSMVFLNSVLSGKLTVGLPTIARDINLSEGLMLWPASVYGLTCGCTLLLFGTVADVIGSRIVYLVGCFLLSVFTLACGLAKTGIQLIMFRAISGIAMSLCLPSAVSIITASFSTGKRRNVAFACLGAAQPVGFSVGVALGGVFVDTIGWRYGYYIFAAINVLVLLVAIWGIPRDARKTGPMSWKRLGSEIDWVGVFLISASLGMFSYSFAIMTTGIKMIVKPANLTLLILAFIFLATFIFWQSRQERLGRVALIPPSLFHSTPAAPHRARNFSAICISVFFTWAVFNAYQYFTTLYFQQLQHLSSLQASARFVPMIVAGALTNIATGLVVNRISADILCISAAFVSAIAPLLMALAKPTWSYWAAAFIATGLIPISADTLFTISNLVITSVFPPKTHGLAGGVFNTISQIGMSVGLALTAVISTAVSKHEMDSGRGGQAMLKGYQATYWTAFGASIMIVALSWWGLRSIGKVGLKRD
ncbi:hypothetical protein FQN50_007330 [Emmonsiellopsis sp. PD_5]|nr:hypothetical protein FQN50_007330 [Emmonsiellopsis sp. PD_5]